MSAEPGRRGEHEIAEEKPQAEELAFVLDHGLNLIREARKCVRGHCTRHVKTKSRAALEQANRRISANGRFQLVPANSLHYIRRLLIPIGQKGCAMKKIHHMVLVKFAS